MGVPAVVSGRLSAVRDLQRPDLSDVPHLLENLLDLAVTEEGLQGLSLLVQQIAHGMDPNSTDQSGNTLLILAAREDQPQVVAELLKQRGIKLDARNAAGDSALMLASLRGYTGIAEQLVKAGAPFDHEGWNPLLYAAFEGRTAIVELLLAKGANPDARAPNRSSALMFAARNGHEEVVTRLLKAGADLDLKNDQNETAESWAVKYRNTDIAEMKKRAVEQSIEIINKRIDETGTKEPTVVRQGEDRIVVQVPGYGDPQHLKDLIGKTAKMEFKLVDEVAESTGTRSAGSTQLPVIEKDGGPSQKLWIKEQTMVSGENLVDAQQGFEGGMPIVQFKFDNLGARKFGDATKANVGKRFAIVLDNQIISAPVIKTMVHIGQPVRGLTAMPNSKTTVPIRADCVSK